MLKILDRYLLRHFFSSLIVVTIALGMTFIVINAIEQLRHFIDNQVPFFTIVEYYFYFAGWILKSFLPMFILLAILFSVSILARKNELLAMKASGISLYRITITFSLVVLLVSAGHFMDLWEIILLYLGKHVHLGNPKLPIYINARFQNFKDTLMGGYLGNELALRNNNKIRTLFLQREFNILYMVRRSISGI